MSNLRKAAQALIDHFDTHEYKNCTGIMAGHIVALREALQPKVISKPKLSETDQKIVEYCCRPRTSTEIAIYARITMGAVYKSLRLLQRLGLLEKMQVDKPTGHNHGVTFKATGKSIEEDWMPNYMEYRDRPMVMGVKL